MDYDSLWRYQLGQTFWRLLLSFRQRESKFRANKFQNTVTGAAPVFGLCVYNVHEWWECVMCVKHSGEIIYLPISGQLLTIGTSVYLPISI